MPKRRIAGPSVALTSRWCEVSTAATIPTPSSAIGTAPSAYTGSTRFHAPATSSGLCISRRPPRPHGTNITTSTNIRPT
ncbi:MAG: hypothetical protein U1F67_20130 [Rubrivivax sp.]